LGNGLCAEKEFAWHEPEADKVSQRVK